MIWQSKPIKHILNTIFRYCKNSKLDLDDSQYELFALTVHVGSLNSGHYVAFAKRYNKWYLFNDERVK